MKATPDAEALVAEAIQRATKAHEGQVRKFTNEPYIKHPEAVAAIVANCPHTPVMLAAAWLHDTVEDTDTTLFQLQKDFGREVACLVGYLTKPATPGFTKLTRQEKLTKLITWAGMSTPEAQTIKIADISNNVSNLRAVAPADYTRMYLREKAMLMHALTEGYKPLWNTTFDFIESELKELR